MLVSDITTLKSYIPTISGDNFNRYSTYLKTAEQYLINELIGQTLFDKLTPVTANPSANPPVAAFTPDAKLLAYCENIVSLKGYMEAVPFLDLRETETGFVVASDAGNNVVPASKDRVEKLIRGLDTRLSDTIELLLEYLEGNSTFYDDWKGAKAYTINHDSYIFTLTQFRRYARYDASRLEWLKDMPKITRAIRNRIEPIISAAQSAEIITQLQDNELSAANEKIIEDLRFSLAAFVTGDKETAYSCVFRARQTMIDNIDDYAGFKASSIYTSYLAETSTFSTDHTIGSFGI